MSKRNLTGRLNRPEGRRHLRGGLRGHRRGGGRVGQRRHRCGQDNRYVPSARRPDRPAVQHGRGHREFGPAAGHGRDVHQDVAVLKAHRTAIAVVGRMIGSAAEPGV